VAGRIDDLDHLPRFVGHPQFAAVGREFDMTGTRLGLRLVDGLMRRKINPGQERLVLAGHHQPFAVRTFRYPFRIAPYRDLPGDLPAGEIDRSCRGIVLVGDEQQAPVARG
jgi:hypothetical protein